MNSFKHAKQIFLLLSIVAAATILTLQIAVADDQSQPDAADKPPSKLWSSEDGWLDISGSW
jgi:hypothetical protein